MNTTKILTSFLIILIAFSVFLGIEYAVAYRQNKNLEANMQKQQINSKVVSFEKMFIEKVLQAKSDVSFEDRLKLENAVRDLNDPQILAQWQKFSNSTSESDAQTQTKNLLDLLANKIFY